MTFFFFFFALGVCSIFGMSSGTVVELAKNCSDLSREQKENIVPIEKGGPKIWVSFGTKANKMRFTDHRTVFKSLCSQGASLFIREHISIKMNL